MNEGGPPNSRWPEREAPPSFVFGTSEFAAEEDSGADSEPPSLTGVAGEEFLFHLYRGSELLQDNCVEEAKEELEQALRVRPRDVESQGLLGVVYFRLGLYPRAIQIFLDIVRECPQEVTPKLNLALCYLKTGQPREAREMLEDVIRRVPDHARAWGYLGLVFERLGNWDKAMHAFERAGQPHLARRMQERQEQPQEREAESEPAPSQEVRRAAADAEREIGAGQNEGPFSRASPSEAPPSGRWRALEPGEERVPPPSRSRRSQPPPRVPGELQPSFLPGVAPSAAPFDPETLVGARLLEMPSGGAARTPEGLALIQVTEGLAVRSDRVRAMSHQGRGLSPVPLRRRSRGRETVEPFGPAGSSWVMLEGAGLVVLEPSAGFELVLVQLGGEFVYVRESRLAAFEGLVRYENGRLPAGDPGPVPMVQLAGEGVVVFEARAGLRTAAVSSERPLSARVSAVLGWTGRLLGQAVVLDPSSTTSSGLVAFSGEGAVLLDDA